MLHAREDYNRIQDPQGLIGEDEPVFLLRAKDLMAPDTIRAWVKLQSDAGNTDPCIKISLAWARKMEEWQEKHKEIVKLATINSNTERIVHNGILYKLTNEEIKDGDLICCQDNKTIYKCVARAHERLIGESFINNERCILFTSQFQTLIPV